PTYPGRDHHLFTRGGAPPPPRTYADASPRIRSSSPRHRRSLPDLPNPPDLPRLVTLSSPRHGRAPYLTYFFRGAAFLGAGGAALTLAVRLLKTVSTNMSGEYAPAFFA